jgi:nitrate reductase gamma subunit
MAEKTKKEEKYLIITLVISATYLLIISVINLFYKNNLLKSAEPNLSFVSDSFALIIISLVIINLYYQSYKLYKNNIFSKPTIYWIIIPSIIMIFNLITLFFFIFICSELYRLNKSPNTKLNRLVTKKNKQSKNIFNWSFLGLFIAGIILLNVIASLLYRRIDMTEDGRYSLSKGTIAFLENKSNFENRLNLKIYLEGNLPAELKHFRNTLEDKLKEFKQYAGDRIEYQFIDPNAGTEAEKQDLYRTIYANEKGILPMELVYMKDGEQSKIMIWPGAEIDYGGSTVQTVQFLPGSTVRKPYNLDGITEIINNSINNLEYILISSLRRATEESKPRIAFLQGHGELTYAQTQRARALIAYIYTQPD